MRCARAPWAAPARPLLSQSKHSKRVKKSLSPIFVCLSSGSDADSPELAVGCRGVGRLRLVLHDSLEAAGFEMKHARAERDDFCKQVERLNPIYSETSIAISRGADLARTAMHIANEDDALLASQSSEPLPIEAFLERLDDLSMDFCSLYLPPSRSPPEVFLSNLERFMYVHKGFYRTDLTSDARALYLHSVLTCRSGSLVMLSLIYSEMLKSLRLYGLVNFDVEIYFPHDLLSLPRGYQKQKSKSSDHAHILTSKSLLMEVLRNQKDAFWPFQYDGSVSLFLRAAQAANHEYRQTTSGESHSKLNGGLHLASAKVTQGMLGPGDWANLCLGDMRRALAACERLIILGSQPEELRDYAVLLYHCGHYEDCLEYLKLYQNARVKRCNLSRTDALEENTVKKLVARVNLILAERGWSKQTAPASHWE